MNTLTSLEANAQFLIAQAVMLHDNSLDYEEVWGIASTLLNDFLESEEFWKNELSFSLVENWVNNIPVEKLKQA